MTLLGEAVVTDGANCFMAMNIRIRTGPSDRKGTLRGGGHRRSRHLHRLTPGRADNFVATIRTPVRTIAQTDARLPQATPRESRLREV